ncbi:uncharacterized protein TRAVEDRAFT_30797 [Trametes versicolor FP-101664 SS1]|uniref:uncharacterized protein n=1 Tax=Trametes versicolor (strain FP-101664) TaxID=717944 RepID=UPI0004623E72|nr:uncharacterized protein TRAVEDRAFT_30797 [Trametes versicolor FP-101664 SS1]EIW54762.1 hypothetical protein TRAVEDRAFT_30797 [Trametes versicolor FP-101664 SS1]
MYTVDPRLGDMLPNAPPRDVVNTIPGPVYRCVELAALSAFPARRHVAIGGRCFIMLDDAALAAVAHAWRRATRSSRSTQRARCPVRCVRFAWRQAS